MSKEEMKNLDEQVLQVANSAGEARCADEAAQAERRAEDGCNQANKKKARQNKTRRLLTMLARVAVCLVAVAVFLALMLEPGFWVPVVGCIGIITFIVTGAICIDRYCGRC